MDLNQQDGLGKNERSEEVADIIERIPISFGRWVMFIVIFLMGCLFLFGWFIKYPDVIKGQIVISAQHATVKLIANTSGKLLLQGFKPQDKVKEGDYIAIIENSARTADIIKVSDLLASLSLDDKNSLAEKRNLFPEKVALGEVSLKYFNFINALMRFCSYQEKNTYEKQEENLVQYVGQQSEILAQTYKSKKIKAEVLGIASKALKRDSAIQTQYSNNVVSEVEVERIQMDYLTAKDNYQNVSKEITYQHMQINEAKNKLAQLRIEKKDKEKQMRLDLMSTYNDLQDNIRQWEQKYVFKAPFGGKVEYLKFWANNQFIQAGEEVFTIIPEKNKIVGQVQLPANGMGKVKIGCDVIIKLDNYPYMEYGSVKGKVKAISLTPNSIKTDNQGDTGSYLVLVDLPNELTTNYGTKLEFKYELKGTVEIITNSRRLMQRLFDNFRYTLHQ